MKRITEYEYKSLRDEMISRIQLMYSHNVGLITAIFAAFAIAASFSTWFYGQVEIASNSMATEDYRLILTFSSILISIFVLSPLGIMLPFSVRNRDNVGQIESLSAYIIVFAEVPSLLSKNDSDYIGWETLQKKATLEKGVLKLFNVEYSIFACVSFLIFVISSIINIVLSFRYEIMNSIVLICVSIVLMMLSLNTVIMIVLKSNNARFFSNRKKLIRMYVTKAIESGFVSDSERDAFYSLVNQFLTK
ncbi:MAG: hypothetical protein IJQ66_04700 [Clostridia bacterium]|nr:hypothetical protein [Clostridia bacterium]